MKVRQAEVGDIPDILRMMKDFHDYNKPAWPLDIPASAETMRQLIQSPDAFVAVSGGFIAGVMQASPISPDWLTAKEFLWWSEGGKGLRLLRGFREWAQANGANEIQMSCPVGARAEKAFSRYGSGQEIIYSEICHVH